MTIPPTPSKIEVTLSGQKIELFMSYALLNRLTVRIGGPDQVALLAGEPTVQEPVLIEVFTKREKGKIIEAPETLDEIEVSLEDIGRVLDWVGGHIIDFFVRTVEQAMQRQQKMAGKVEALAHTATGLQNSASRIHAASASEPTPPT